MDNEENAAFRLKVIVIIVGILFISPFIVSILSIWPKTLTFIEFDSSVWIGFWGSFAGGILGTAGVIYVAYLQNAAQKSSMETIEKNNLKRLRVQTLLNLLDDSNKEVSDLLNDVIPILSNINGVVKNMNELRMMNLSKLTGIPSVDDDSHFSKNLQHYRNNLLRMELTPKYITNKLGQLEYKNLILIEQGLVLNKKLNGQESVYMDKVIEEICSNNFSEFKLKEIITEASKCEEKDYSKILEWLLLEQSLIHNASSQLLDELSPK